MNSNISGVISNMMRIYASAQQPEVKMNNVDHLLTENWGAIITSSGRNDADALQTLGAQFRFLATSSTDPQLRERMTGLANRLTIASKEMQKPNLSMDEDGMLLTEDEMRVKREMQEERNQKRWEEGPPHG